MEGTARELFEVEAMADDAYNPFSAILDEPREKGLQQKLCQILKRKYEKESFWTFSFS